MARIAVEVDTIPDVLRSDLIFVGDDGSVEPFDGGLVVRTPSNPGYWWGNCLHFDRPPQAGDVDRWMAAFETHVHARQPASSHHAFGWDGDAPGEVEPFVAAGFRCFETMTLAVDRGQAVVAPKRPDVAIDRIATDDGWDGVRRLEVATRDAGFDEAPYDTFVARRITRWHALDAAGQGGWFAVHDDGRVVASLGVFAEAERGRDGRRIGRFQHVSTHPSMRRRGLASRLVEHASRFAFEQLDVDTLLISADAHDVARLVYEGCGFERRSRHHGLERGH